MNNKFVLTITSITILEYYSVALTVLAYLMSLFLYYLYFVVQILRHELGHTLGIGHTFTRAYPPGWDCGPEGSIMGGNDIVNWNPCGVMDFRRMYTQYSDNWCLPG